MPGLARRRPALLAVAAVLLAGCLARGVPAPVPHAGGTASAACAECHQAIHDEWRDSAHAAAFTSEEYQLAGRRHPEADCLRCHVPESLDRIAEAPVRTLRLEEGVNCESCHLTGESYAAPSIFTSHTDHETTVNELLARSEFCGRCHEAVFAQWSAVDVPQADRKTCQQCHMPAVERRTVSGSFWHRFHEKAEGRRHVFALPEPDAGGPPVEMAVALDEASAGGVRGHVVLTNVGAQHSLPGGEYGFRELAIVVAVTDRYGVASAKHIDRFVAQKDRRLAHRIALVLPFRFGPLPEDAEAIQVSLLRSSFDGVERVMAEARLPLRPAGEG